MTDLQIETLRTSFRLFRVHETGKPVPNKLLMNYSADEPKHQFQTAKNVVNNLHRVDGMDASGTNDVIDATLVSLTTVP